MASSESRARPAGALRVDAAEAGAAVADLGVILPVAAGLVLVNGVDPVAAFGVVGALFVAAGLAYRLPVPVQPIKAAAAIAIATGARAEVLAAAGLLIGAVLVLLAAVRAGPLLLRLFPKPVIRGNQLGVGLLLVVAAVSLVRRAPGGSDGAGIAVAAAVAMVVAATAGRRRPVALGIVVAGVAWTLATGGVPAGLGLHPALPALDLPGGAALLTALTLLVIPQLPLTLGNAVVGTSDLARDYFGDRAARVTPGALALTSGLGNLAAGFLGGMPVCHGSSGMTAYRRLGARGGGVALVAGGGFLAAALLFGRAAPAAFALVPLPVLGGLLAYTGARHAMLVADLGGSDLVVALAMGAVGAATRNLALGMAVGIPMIAIVRVWPRPRTGLARRAAGTAR